MEETLRQGDLRSGCSLWRATGAPALDCPPLDGDLACDVALIGGGITGALVGYHLTRAGLNTVVVDKGEIGAGSTAASTGLLQYETDTSLVELIRKRGERHAVHAYRRGLRAIDELEDAISQLDNRCGFSRRSTLYLASHEADLPEFRQEHECRRQHGFDVRLLERDALAEFCGLKAPAGMYSTGDGQVDPYRLTQALIRNAQSQGLIAFSRTNVKAIQEGSSGVTLSHERGTIAAGHVVFCTGYWTHQYLDEEIGSLHSTYAVASQPMNPPPRWPEGCLIWETARPYFYARRTDDGRTIIGGGDTDFSGDHWDEALLAAKARRLSEKFGRLFPESRFEPACVWGGAFGETNDGLPFIGTPSGRQRVYFALGYGGNGITFSAIAARLIVDLILKRPTDDAEVFRFGR